MSHRPTEADPASLPKAPDLVHVTDDERSRITEAADSLEEQYGDVDSAEFRRMLPGLAGRYLPERIYAVLADFREAFGRTDYGALILKGAIDVDHERLGPTPVRWQDSKRENVKRFEFVTALVHGALGGALAQFYYQREGGGFSHCVIQDPEMKETETGAGEVELKLHTEGSNLDHGPDFITFLWLRNNERVPCYLFSIRSVDLAEAGYEQKLWEPIFKKPLAKNLEAAARRWGDRTIPVLHGNPQYPWLRVDFVEQLAPRAAQSEDAQEALEAFERDVQAATYKAFEPGSGDLCVLNNKMCAHGRGPLKAGVDPDANVVEKRWMMRMMSTVDRFAFYETAESDRPSFSVEMYAGKTFDLKRVENE